MTHTAKLDKDSLKKTPKGGLAFVIKCCGGAAVPGGYEKSFHWEQPHHFSDDENDRRIALKEQQVAQEHAAHDATDRFIQRVKGARPK